MHECIYLAAEWIVTYLRELTHMMFTLRGAVVLLLDMTEASKSRYLRNSRVHQQCATNHHRRHHMCIWLILPCLIIPPHPPNYCDYCFPCLLLVIIRWRPRACTQGREQLCHWLGRGTGWVSRYFLQEIKIVTLPRERWGKNSIRPWITLS